jgi:hypothetical protein
MYGTKGNPAAALIKNGANPAQAPIRNRVNPDVAQAPSGCSADQTSRSATAGSVVSRRSRDNAQSDERRVVRVGGTEPYAPNSGFSEGQGVVSYSETPSRLPV